MDKANPIPAAYATLLAQRRHDLHAELAQILAGGSRFLWEVGCGHGHFLSAYAAAHPATLCIGIDLASERIARAVRKRDRAQLGNLHFLRSEARLFLQSLPPGTQISEVFVLFPDPWPKSRHHKHRILQPDFLSLIASRAAPGCRLYFRTDHRPYFDDTHAMIVSSPDWVMDSTPWPFEFETVFQCRAQQYDSLIARRRIVSP